MGSEPGAGVTMDSPVVDVETTFGIECPPTNIAVLAILFAGAEAGVGTSVGAGVEATMI